MKNMHIKKENLVYVPSGVPMYYKKDGSIARSTEPTVLFVVDHNVTSEGGDHPYFLHGGNETIIKVFYNGGHAFLYKKDVFPVSEDIDYDVKTKRSV